MGRVAIDFGTANTVVARLNENTGRVETIDIPGITTTRSYRLAASGPELSVRGIPSLIHYSERETLVGDQVLARGLADHPHTFRWMKRYIGQGAGGQQRRTGQGLKSHAEAGAEFLRLVLGYATDQISATRDEFTFTLPVEAFEDFQDWLLRVGESAGLVRVRFVDEPTACMLGYRETCRGEDRFLVFDFGCGTLDVSATRVDLQSKSDRKTVVLGKAGCDLGGLDVDRWLADDFCQRHGITGAEKRAIRALVERRAEEVKIALSDPREQDATLLVALDRGGAMRSLVTTYTRSCNSCERGRPGEHPDPGDACLGCLLVRPRSPGDRSFAQRVRATVETALENAAVKSGLRRGELSRVLVTGGTSLMPAVRAVLDDLFPGRLCLESPFDAVVRGACQGIVVPILQHDYAIESWDPGGKRHRFRALYERGTEYPTDLERRMWARGVFDGQSAVGIKIFEVSHVKRHDLAAAGVDESGALRAESRVQTECAYIALNGANPTFIVCDPPWVGARDRRRFFCRFRVDGQRRLLVTVSDQQAGRVLLADHPVVRL